jgi:hypothetical protein
MLMKSAMIAIQTMVMVVVQIANWNTAVME